MTRSRFACLAALLACSSLGGCRKAQQEPPLQAPCALYDCGGACVDIRIDASHCGACGHACLQGEVCSAGVCAGSCEVPLAVCRTADAVRCTALLTDSANCGACGVSCRAGEVCSAGTCARSCEAPLVACGEGEGAWCAELAGDRLNCGGCGHACAPGQVCDRGACAQTCEGAGKASCSGACADLLADDRHCGECGRSCAATERCSGAACRDLCALGGLSRCGDSCVDLESDAAHCGTCVRSCAAGGTCQAGSCVGPVCAGGLFLPGRPDIAEAVGATSLLASDLDGDGLSDLLLPEFEGARIQLLRGQKGGGFGAAEDAIASKGRPVVAADLDGDGDRDVLVSEESGLLLYRNDGTGHFSPGIGYPTSGVNLGAYGAQVADFDGDGILDVLSYGYSISVWRSSAEAPDRNVGSLYNIQVVRAADLDGDNRPDLIVGTRDWGVSAYVIMNQGDGVFGAPVKIDARSGIDRLEAADLDGDGRPDAVFLGQSLESPYPYMLGILHNVQGVLTAGQTLALPATAYLWQLLVADLDGDRRPEVVIGERDAYRIFQNRGDGTFDSPVLVPSGGIDGLAALDVDGDGRMELVSSNRERCGVEIRRQLASGRYDGPEVLPIPAGQVLLADLDGDGRDDLIALLGVTANSGNRGTIEVRLSGPAGFGPPLSLSGFGWIGVQAGDLDGDGAIDLVVRSTSNPSVLLNRGDGTFRDEVPVLEMGDDSRLADVTGDGILDLVDVGRSYPSRLRVAMGLGNGAFASPVITPMSSSNSGAIIATGDVDGDGHADVVILETYASSMHYFPGQSDGTFGPPVELEVELPSLSNPDAIAVGDLDADGRADVAALYSWYGSGSRSNALVLARKALTEAEVLPLNGSRYGLAIASIGGGGRADLVVAGTGSLGVLAARGDGSFAPEVRWSLPNAIGAPVVGDVDGDLRADIVIAGSDHLVLFRGACPGE